MSLSQHIIYPARGLCSVAICGHFNKLKEDEPRLTLIPVLLYLKALANTDTISALYIWGNMTMLVFFCVKYYVTNIASKNGQNMFQTGGTLYCESCISWLCKNTDYWTAGIQLFRNLVILIHHKHILQNRNVSISFQVRMTSFETVECLVYWDAYRHALKMF